jgi:serine protease Do
MKSKIKILFLAFSLFGAAMAQSSGGGVSIVTTNSSRSYLGVGVKEVTEQRARELRLTEEAGVEVTQVDDDSPAAKAGLKLGDVVMEYNGQRIEGSEQFVRLVRETPVGRTVKLRVSRAGVSQPLSATIAQRRSRMTTRQLDSWPRMRSMELPEIRIPDIPSALLSWRSGMLGIEAEGLESQLADFFGVKQGVLVRKVMQDSPAERGGLKAGDVILKINETSVSSPREVTQAVLADRDKKVVAVRVMRSKSELGLEVEVAESRRRTTATPASQTKPEEFD